MKRAIVSLVCAAALLAAILPADAMAVRDPEAKKLKMELKALRAEVKAAKANGKVGKEEKARLRAERNRLKSEIRARKQTQVGK